MPTSLSAFKQILTTSLSSLVHWPRPLTEEYNSIVQPLWTTSLDGTVGLDYFLITLLDLYFSSLCRDELCTMIFNNWVNSICELPKKELLSNIHYMMVIVFHPMHKITFLFLPSSYLYIIITPFSHWYLFCTLLNYYNYHQNSKSIYKHLQVSNGGLT